MHQTFERAKRQRPRPVLSTFRWNRIPAKPPSRAPPRLTTARPMSATMPPVVRVPRRSESLEIRSAARARCPQRRDDVEHGDHCGSDDGPQVVAYFCGGYVAGRLARFNGLKQGFGFEGSLARFSLSRRFSRRDLTRASERTSGR